jgi:site-specific recombinase XerD
LLRDLIAESTRCEPDPANTLIFVNARGTGLTRYGVRYLLRRYAAKGARLAPTLRDKSLHPHSIRHSTAIALLKAGVDFATISQWLGHALCLFRAVTNTVMARRSWSGFQQNVAVKSTCNVAGAA